MKDMQNDLPAPEQSRTALGGQAENVDEKSHLDFLTAIVLIIASIAVIVTSIGYWKKQGCLFYESAGFMPTIIGAALLIMNIRLLTESLHSASVSKQLIRLKEAFLKTAKSRRVHKSIIGLGIFAVYVYFMLGRLPFWLASVIALAAVLIYVHFDKSVKTTVKMLIIAALAIACIVGLFQYAFSVPMP